MSRVLVVGIVISGLALMNVASAVTIAALGAKLARVLVPNGDPCDGVDCPSYVLDRDGDGYVVRKYPAALWAYRNISESGFVAAEGKGFEALLRYFGGANKEEKVLGSSEPALTLFHTKDGLSGVVNDFTVSFYVPNSYQEGVLPPEPLSADVQLFQTSPAVAFVSNFTGFALQGTILNQARALHAKLKRDNVNFKEDHFWFATYSPYKQIFHRYNEIWFTTGDEFRGAPILDREVVKIARNGHAELLMDAVWTEGAPDVSVPTKFT